MKMGLLRWFLRVKIIKSDVITDGWCGPTPMAQEGKVACPLKGSRAIDHLLIDNLWILASRPNTAAVVRDLVEARMAADRLTVLASDLTLEQWAVKQPDMATLLSNGAVVQLS